MKHFLVRYNLALLLQLVWAVAWCVFKASTLFSYWGAGLLTVGMFLGLIFFLYNKLLPQEKIWYAPGFFFGLWLFGSILGNGFGAVAPLNPALGNYIADASVGAGVLSTISTVRELFFADDT
jgi:hypothetical protein